MESEFSVNTRTFVKEAFQIAEWALVVSALIVAGKKLDIPIATWSGYTFGGMLCFYLGVRMYALLEFARPQQTDHNFSTPRMIIIVCTSAIFGLGLSSLVNALIRAAG